VFELIKEPSFDCFKPTGLSTRQLSDQTANVLVKMLRKNKADRYQTILEALTDLTREPIQTCPNCNASNPLVARFCAQCGQSLKEVSQPQPTKQPITTATEKPKTADELTAEGFQFAQEGQWERAIQKYREAIASTPTTVVLTQT
jgi:zinc ribbon protein